MWKGNLIARPLAIYLISTRTLEESTNGCARGREGVFVSLLLILFDCLFDRKVFQKEIRNCPDTGYKKQVVENVSRRIGMPFYIPLISLIASFLLISRRDKKDIFLSKYIYFIFGFVILILAEIMLRFSGFSSLNTLLYFLFPLIMLTILYLTLIKKFSDEKISP